MAEYDTDRLPRRTESGEWGVGSGEREAKKDEVMGKRS